MKDSIETNERCLLLVYFVSLTVIDNIPDSAILHLQLIRRLDLYVSLRINFSDDPIRRGVKTNWISLKTVPR